MKNANIVQVCPKCFVYVANLKKHRKWHRRHPRTGPMGPPGPVGATGISAAPATTTSGVYIPISPELSMHLDGYSWNAKESKEEFMRRYEDEDEDE